jgi:hypothetical protein
MGFPSKQDHWVFLPTTYFEAVNEMSHFNATYEVMIER